MQTFKEYSALPLLLTPCCSSFTSFFILLALWGIATLVFHIADLHQQIRELEEALE